MILLIDNYDSFTYNLYQLIGSLTHQQVQVVKNDHVTVADLDTPDLNGLVLSPGPGRPEAAGNMNQVLKAAIGRYPILGICLGHQAIGEVYGAEVKLAPQPMHGKTDVVSIQRHNGILKDCPERFTVGRYHSLAIAAESIPSELQIDALCSDGTVQAVSDDDNQVYGLEFHPESIMTNQKVAHQMVTNFLGLTER